MSQTVTATLVELLAKVDRLRLSYRLDNWEDSWNWSKTEGIVPIDDLDVAQLIDLARLGCLVTLEIEGGGPIAQGDGPAGFRIDPPTDWIQLVPDEAAADRADEAVENGDLGLLLSTFRPGVTARLAVTLRHPGVVWIRTTAVLTMQRDQHGWYGVATLLVDRQERQHHVVVLDASDAVVHGGNVIVHGPATWPNGAPPATGPYNEVTAVMHSRPDAPLPSALWPTSAVGHALQPAADLMSSVAGALAWLHLAGSAAVDNGSVAVAILGNRPLTGSLPSCPPTLAAESVDLWSWVAATGPAAAAAVTQATSMHASSVADVYERAAVIKSTAKVFFELAQSGLIEEAFAARRAARDAAIAAGRSAADRSRNAARSAVDRVLVVLAGAIGIVLANKGELIDRPVAFALLGLAALLTIGAALLAYHLDLPGAARAITVFRMELAGQHDTLPDADISTIDQLPSLLDGEAEVVRARRACTFILGLAGVALVVLGIVTAIGQHPSSEAPPSPATSAVVEATDP